jgi:uncharacterized membrane protein
MTMHQTPEERRRSRVSDGPAEPDAGDSWRLRVDRHVASASNTVVHAVLLHWLAILNVGLAVFLALAFLAPALVAAGLHGPGAWIYSAYALACHQWPFRSFFLFGQQVVYPPDVLRTLVGDAEIYSFVGSSALGYKVALCQRDVAIYTAMLVGGIWFSSVRGRLRPPPLLLFGLLLIPIALDGFSQLLGFRESTWELRLLTGALFGLAAVWLIYPQVERSARRAAYSFGLL